MAKHSTNQLKNT